MWDFFLVFIFYLDHPVLSLAFRMVRLFPRLCSLIIQSAEWEACWCKATSYGDLTFTCAAPLFGLANRIELLRLMIISLFVFAGSSVYRKCAITSVLHIGAAEFFLLFLLTDHGSVCVRRIITCTRVTAIGSTLLTFRAWIMVMCDLSRWESWLYCRTEI